MSEPIETIIVRAQQNFDIIGGLNPMQIEREDDNVLNILKRYKNSVYKITPLGLLFPATVINDTTHIFITAKKLSGVRKSLLNRKIYSLLALINIDKINNWEEVKGQSVWTNVAFKEQKEISKNTHVYFPVMTKSFSDIMSFSIVLQEDQNKKIEFSSGQKKISIFNFQIKIFLVLARQLKKRT